MPLRAEYIRVITSELQRIASHLVGWGAWIMDLGGLTPILYAFDDRERILDLMEHICGARLTYCYYRFGGLCNDVDDYFLQGSRDELANLELLVPLVARPMAHAVHVPLGVMVMLAALAFIFWQAPSITTVDRIPARF